MEIASFLVVATIAALAGAEGAFKAELKAVDARADPIAWAVLQVSLARLYEARAELIEVFRERESAVYALEEALETFCEFGLKTLAETASTALERIRGGATI